MIVTYFSYCPQYNLFMREIPSSCPQGHLRPRVVYPAHVISPAALSKGHLKVTQGHTPSTIGINRLTEPRHREVRANIHHRFEKLTFPYEL